MTTWQTWRANLLSKTLFQGNAAIAGLPWLSQDELADALVISAGRACCLKALIDKSWSRQNFHNNKNKRVYAYLLTPQGITEKANMTMRFLQREMVEYELLKEEIESLQQDLEQQPIRQNFTW